MKLPAFNKISATAHVLVLAGLLVFLSLPFTWPVSLPNNFWIKQAVEYCCWVGIYYLNLYLLIPRFIFHGRSGWFVLVVISLLVLMVSADHRLDQLLNLQALIKMTNPQFNPSDFPIRLIADLSIVVVTLILFGISTIITVVQRIQQDQLRERSLEKDKISTELSFLKTQINPHFFF